MTAGEVCKSCGAAIVWAKTSMGKLAPYERDDANGKWAVVAGIARLLEPTDVERFTSHFATCPQAAQWRKRRK